MHIYPDSSKALIRDSKSTSAQSTVTREVLRKAAETKAGHCANSFNSKWINSKIQALGIKYFECISHKQNFTVGNLEKNEYPCLELFIFTKILIFKILFFRVIQPFPMNPRSTLANVPQTWLQISIICGALKYIYVGI